MSTPSPWLEPLRLRGWFVRMSFHTKFWVVGMLVATPLCMLAGFAAAQFHHEARVTQARAESLERASRARDLIESLALHRGLTASVLAGAEGFSGSLVEQQALVQERLARVLDRLPTDGSRPDLPSHSAIGQEVRALLTLPDAREPKRNFERHNRVIDELVVMLTRTGYRGATTNGPELAGAYELAFVSLPSLVESLGRQRGWGSAVLQQRQFDPGEVATHLLLAGAVVQRLDLLRADAHAMAELEKLWQHEPGTLASAVARLRTALVEAEVFSQRSVALVLMRSADEGLAAQHFADGTAAIDRLLLTAREITNHLQQGTVQRQQRAEALRAVSAAALVIMLLGLALVYREFSLSTVQRLKRLAQASGRLAAGEFGEHVAVDGSDEIAALAEALDAMRLRLRQAVDDSANAMAARSAERTRTEFVARWSHDLRTPLSAVLGFARVLREGAAGRLNAEQLADLARIQTAAEHLLALVDDVLAVSSAEWREAELKRQPLNVPALLRDATDLLQPQARARGIRVGLQLPPALPPVLADRTRLLQVLANLVGNAIKFNTDQGFVTLAAQAEGEQLRIDVVDGGPGIDPALLPRLFTPFERLDAPRRGVPGSGLGLVTVKRLVEAMQGRIAVQSQLGEGTRFSLWLPLAHTEAEPSASSPGAVSGPAAAAPPPRGRSGLRLSGRLAYVEDNATNVELLRAMLALRSDIVLTAFGDGASALASDERFDLWVLDHQLPDTDGIALLAALRQQRGHHLPAVLFTADVQPQRREAALAAGFAECWNKPLSLDLLETSLLRLWPR